MSSPTQPLSISSPAVEHGVWRREARSLIALAFPVICTQLGIMLMGTVDVMMLGRLSKEGLAAGALGNAVGFGLLVFPMGLLLGLDPLIAQAFGAGEHRRIAGHLWRGAILAVAMSIPVSVDHVPRRVAARPAGTGGAAADRRRLPTCAP